MRQSVSHMGVGPHGPPASFLHRSGSRSLELPTANRCSCFFKGQAHRSGSCRPGSSSGHKFPWPPPECPESVPTFFPTQQAGVHCTSVTH